MKTFITFFFVVINLSVTSGQTNLNGLYKGFEEMCTRDSLGIKDCFSDSSRPERKWYHLNYLKIKGDSVYLDQIPISVYQNDTLYSASDGGFYYYRGIIKKLTENTIWIDLTELYCDYCGNEVQVQQDGTLKEGERKKQYIGKLVNELIEIDNVVYKKEILCPYSVTYDKLSR